jgi:hypothetical protein
MLYVVEGDQKDFGIIGSIYNVHFKPTIFNAKIAMKEEKKCLK